MNISPPPPPNYRACYGTDLPLCKQPLRHLFSTLHKVEGQLNILILLSWHGRFHTSMLIISCFYMYNYNTVSSLHDEAMAKLAIATGHATCMQVFNDLQYSNKCKFVSIS